MPLNSTNQYCVCLFWRMLLEMLCFSTSFLKDRRLRYTKFIDNLYLFAHCALLNMR